MARPVSAEVPLDKLALVAEPRVLPEQDGQELAGRLGPVVARQARLVPAEVLPVLVEPAQVDRLELEEAQRARRMPVAVRAGKPELAEVKVHSKNRVAALRNPAQQAHEAIAAFREADLAVAVVEAGFSAVEDREAAEVAVRAAVEVAVDADPGTVERCIKVTGT